MQRNTNSNRIGRVNEELKRELSNIINYEVKNSNVTGMISVTKVKTSPDLKYARVSVSILNSKNIKQTLAGLKAASGFIRSRIAEKMNLRVTPEFVFELDDSLVYGEKIDRILELYIEKYYDDNDDKDTWFNKIKDLAGEMGYAKEVKEFKENPEKYEAHVGDVSTVLRVALTARTNTPDMYEIMKILGKERIKERFEKGLIEN